MGGGSGGGRQGGHWHKYQICKPQCVSLFCEVHSPLAVSQSCGWPLQYVKVPHIEPVSLAAVSFAPKASSSAANMPGTGAKERRRGGNATHLDSWRWPCEPRMRVSCCERSRRREAREAEERRGAEGGLLESEEGATPCMVLPGDSGLACGARLGMADGGGKAYSCR